MKAAAVFPLIFVGTILIGAHAKAHDACNNGQAVPEWVKRVCCGPTEAHNLRDNEVERSRRAI